MLPDNYSYPFTFEFPKKAIIERIREQSATEASIATIWVDFANAVIDLNSYHSDINYPLIYEIKSIASKKKHYVFGEIRIKYNDPTGPKSQVKSLDIYNRYLSKDKDKGFSSQELTLASFLTSPDLHLRKLAQFALEHEGEEILFDNTYSYNTYEEIILKHSEFKLKPHPESRLSEALSKDNCLVNLEDVLGKLSREKLDSILETFKTYSELPFLFDYTERKLIYSLLNGNTEFTRLLPEGRIEFESAEKKTLQKALTKINEKYLYVERHRKLLRKIILHFNLVKFEFDLDRYISGETTRINCSSKLTEFTIYLKAGNDEAVFKSILKILNQ